MYCVTTARVNNFKEKVCYRYGDTEIDMPVFIDDISAVGEAEEIKKEIRQWEH